MKKSLPIQAIHILLNHANCRGKLTIMAIATMIGGVIDVLGIAGFIPLILMIAEPAQIPTLPVVGYFYHYFNFQNTESFILAFIATIIFLFVLKNIGLIYLHYRQGKFALDAGTAISKKMVNHYFAKDFLFFKKTESYSISHNSVVIPHTFAIGVVIPGFHLLAELWVILLIVTAIAIYNVSLFLAISLIIVPVGFSIFYFIKNRMAVLGADRNKYQQGAYAVLHQAIGGYVDVKLMGKESLFTNNFIALTKTLHAIMAKINGYNNSTRYLLETGALLAILVVAIYAFAFGGGISQLLVFTVMLATAAYRILPSGSRILQSIFSIKAHQHCFQIIRSELETEHETVPHNMEPVGGIEEFRSGISFNKVSFTYPGTEIPAVDDISIIIEKGKIIGIFGPSGCGKSTLIYLLTGFLKPSEGEISVDNMPLQRLEIASYYKKIALARQENFFTTGSLLENICFDEAKNPDKLKLEKAIKLAALEEVINNLPKGLDTPSGESANTLSSGQKQRFGIARAIYRDADIIIFDEATNAIDIDTENLITNAFLQLKKEGKTIVLISHKPNTLKVCDKIILLREGKVEGELTPLQLQQHAHNLITEEKI